MGIHDRDYAFDEDRANLYGGNARSQRRYGRLSRWSANTWIITINIAIHVLRLFVPTAPTKGLSMGQDWLHTLGHFSTYEVTWQGGLEFWRFITFQFLHANLLHLGFNMLGLYVFGSLVEQHLGRKKYVAFYLACGIFGGLLFLLLNAIGLWLTPAGATNTPIPLLLTSNPLAPLVGASAGVFGVIVACAYLAPNEIIDIPFPPVSLRMKVVAYVYVGIAFVNLLFAGQNQGGDAAHIGGAIAGFFLARHSHLLRDFFDVLGDSRKGPARTKFGPQSGSKNSPKLRLVRPDSPSSPSSPSARPPKQSPGEAELDRILAKHKQAGANSLSTAERETLRLATQARRDADPS